MKCPTDGHDCQPFPRTGQLSSNMSVQLDVLRDKFAADRSLIYCYIIATVKNQDGYFVQTGSGPNFQGGLISLCTCKHRMRTFLDAEAWAGKWIAGFTGVKAGNGRNALVYLMQVSQAYQSHLALWSADAMPTKAKLAKAAHSNEFGDVYQPQSSRGNPFDPREYVRPHPDHGHLSNDCWHKDIDYRGCSGRPAALLVGHPKHSFLWDHPMILYRDRLYRGAKKFALGDLMHRLETGGEL